MNKQEIMRFVSSAALFALVLASVPVRAEDTAAAESVTDKGQKSRGAGIHDDIKSRSVQNNPQVKPDAPPSKGGQTARGCGTLRIDNRTPWKIQIFADGDYIGLVPGYGDLYYNCCGSHGLFGLAEFTDGDEFTWGPRRISCPYTWSLSD